MSTLNINWGTSTRNDLLKDGAVRKWFNSSLKTTPIYYKELVNDEKTNDYIEYDRSITGLGLASEIVDGQNIPLDVPVFGNSKSYAQRRFGNGFRMTKMLNKFNKIGLFEKLSKDLGKTMRESKDIEVHVMFNNPTSTALTCGTGFDGLAIANDTHTGLVSGTADNYDNYLNASLSYSSLESARYYFKTLKDDRGLLRGGNPTKLVIEPTLWPTAAEILKSGSKPHEQSNTKNVFENYLTIYEDPRLTSTTAWFVIDKDSDIYGFNVFTSQEPDLIIKDAPDNTGDRVCIADQMFTYGWNDPRCIYWGKA